MMRSRKYAPFVALALGISSAGAAQEANDHPARTEFEATAAGTQWLAAIVAAIIVGIVIAKTGSEDDSAASP